MISASTVRLIVKDEGEEEEYFDAKAEPVDDDNEEEDVEEFDHASFHASFEEIQFQYHTHRQLMWDDSNHWKVLTQMYGSVWPRVLPYCLFNALWTCLLWYLKNQRNQDWTVHPSAHKYASTLMSFLLVSRLSITLNGYMENSKHLTFLLKSCRELVSSVCVLTCNETGRRAKQWRQDVVFGVLVVLRVTISALRFQTNPTGHPWRLPKVALEYEEESDTIFTNNQATPSPHVEDPLYRPSSPETRQPSFLTLFRDVNNNKTEKDMNEKFRISLRSRLAHLRGEERKVIEEECRPPFILALQARKEILKHRDGSWFRSTSVLSVGDELRFLDFVGDMLKAISGLFKVMTTPIPLPLVQMNKTFLFVWLFTVPMCIVNESYTDDKSSSGIAAAVIVFMITFGFLGLEHVSVELTDSFGNDPSDFDILGLAHLCIEDCYMCIYHQDGKAWAHALRKRLIDRATTTPTTTTTTTTTTLSSQLSPGRDSNGDLDHSGLSWLV